MDEAFAYVAIDAILSPVNSQLKLTALIFSCVIDVLKFENVSQLLVDSGCLLLILKILGLQDMAATLQEQSEGQEYRYFKEVNIETLHSYLLLTWYVL